MGVSLARADAPGVGDYGIMWCDTSHEAFGPVLDYGLMRGFLADAPATYDPRRAHHRGDLRDDLDAYRADPADRPHPNPAAYWGVA